jgi:outer membrane lipoprotein-sorting protein
VLDTMPFRRLWLVGVLSCRLVCAQESVPPNTAASNPQLAYIVEQMRKAQSDSRLTDSYQVIREYRLFGDGGSSPSSEVWAKVDYSPPNHKTFVIQKRAGSSRGEDVVRRILQHESQMAAGSRSQATIDQNNYSFGYLGEASLDGSPCYLMSLNPKRKEVDLIRGTAWVDQRSFLVRRVEGQMARSPHWLLKKVNLKIDFADVGGIWLQTRTEAVAEVHFLGSQTLKSEIVDARVSSLLTEKTPPAVRARNGKPNRSRMSATVVVPLDHSQ